VVHSNVDGVSGTSSNQTHTVFNGHFPGIPGLAVCPLESQSPVILILSILTEQAKTLIPTGYFRLYPPTYINHNPKGF